MLGLWLLLTGSSLPGPGDRSTDPAAPSSDSGSNSQTVAIAAGVAGGVGALVIAGLTAWLVVHRHKKKNVKQASSDRDLSLVSVTQHSLHHHANAVG